jgi:hypothetical protein
MGALEGGARLVCHAMDDLLGGELVGKRVRLPRPDVDEVDILSASPVGSQRGCQMVDLRVRRGSRIGVLFEEAIADSASEPPSERAGERSGAIVRGKGLLVDR